MAFFFPAVGWHLESIHSQSTLQRIVLIQGKATCEPEVGNEPQSSFPDSLPNCYNLSSAYWSKNQLITSISNFLPSNTWPFSESFQDLLVEAFIMAPLLERLWMRKRWIGAGMQPLLSEEWEMQEWRLIGTLQEGLSRGVKRKIGLFMDHSVQQQVEEHIQDTFLRQGADKKPWKQCRNGRSPSYTW